LGAALFVAERFTRLAHGPGPLGYVALDPAPLLTLGPECEQTTKQTTDARWPLFSWPPQGWLPAKWLRRPLSPPPAMETPR